MKSFTKKEWDSMSLDEQLQVTKTEYNHKVEIDQEIHYYYDGEWVPATIPCDDCDGEQQWCNCCKCYNQICCVDYGTCGCS